MCINKLLLIEICEMSAPLELSAHDLAGCCSLRQP